MSKVNIEKKIDFIANFKSEFINDNIVKNLTPLLKMNDSEIKNKIKISKFIINKEKRDVIFMHPVSELRFPDVYIPRDSNIKFGIGMNQEIWDKEGKGVLFKLLVDDGKTHELFSKYIDPKNNPEDRKWHDETVDLKRIEGKKVDFIFQTHGAPDGNLDYCFGGWSNPVLISEKKISYNFMKNFVKSGRYNKIKKVDIGVLTINNDIRPAIFEHPPSTITYTDIPIHKNAYLSFGIAMDPKIWDKNTNGVVFKVIIEDDDKKVHNIFSKVLNPAKNSHDRQWHDEKVDLSRFKNQRVNITFKTEGAGIKKSTAYAWAYWSEPQISSSGKTIEIQKNNKKNVILITLDACRADYLGCYGHPTAKTPNLDRLAKEGVLFKNNFSQSDITVPSHLSILTSKFPTVDNNIKIRLDTKINTIPKELKNKGYINCGIVGFEALNSTFIRDIDYDLNDYFDVLATQRVGSTSQNILRQWLEKNIGNPFFVWLHLFDTHSLYLPPLKFAREKTEKNPNKYQKNVILSLPAQKSFENWGIPFDDVSFLKEQYIGEVEYIDYIIGKILNDLGELRVDENTLIIITSDHGESLGEHGIYYDHAGIYDVTIHTPLVMWHPKLLPNGRVIDALSTNIDIFPTIMDILNFIVPGEIDGKSLLPLINNEVSKVHNEIYAENVFGTQMTVRTKKWKLIKTLKDYFYTSNFHRKKGDIELYDLENDPEELTNVAKKYPDIVYNLDKKLIKWIEKGKSDKKMEKLDMDEEVKKRLFDLGYG